MSTRSNIGIQNQDGSVDFSYVHFDGYPDHHWPILTEHYATEDKVRALIDLGDLSCLGENLGEKHDFDSRDEKYDNQCRAYGRDREEPGTEFRHALTFEDFEKRADNDYAYIFRNGRWEWRKHRGAWSPEFEDEPEDDE